MLRKTSQGFVDVHDLGSGASRKPRRRLKRLTALAESRSRAGRRRVSCDLSGSEGTKWTEARGRIRAGSRRRWAPEPAEDCPVNRIGNPGVVILRCKAKCLPNVPNVCRFVLPNNIISTMFMLNAVKFDTFVKR